MLTSQTHHQKILLFMTQEVCKTDDYLVFIIAIGVKPLRFACLCRNMLKGFIRVQWYPKPFFLRPMVKNTNTNWIIDKDIADQTNCLLIAKLNVQLLRCFTYSLYLEIYA